MPLTIEFIPTILTMESSDSAFRFHPCQIRRSRTVQPGHIARPPSALYGDFGRVSAVHYMGDPCISLTFSFQLGPMQCSSPHLTEASGNEHEFPCLSYKTPWLTRCGSGRSEPRAGHTPRSLPALLRRRPR